MVPNSSVWLYDTPLTQLSTNSTTFVIPSYCCYTSLLAMFLHTVKFAAPRVPVDLMTTGCMIDSTSAHQQNGGTCSSETEQKRQGGFVVE